METFQNWRLKTEQNLHPSEMDQYPNKYVISAFVDFFVDDKLFQLDQNYYTSLESKTIKIDTSRGQ